MPGTSVPVLETPDRSDLGAGLWPQIDALAAVMDRQDGDGPLEELVAAVAAVCAAAAQGPDPVPEVIDRLQAALPAGADPRR